MAYSLFNKFDEEVEIAKLSSNQENPILDPSYDLGAQLAVSNVEEISVTNPFAGATKNITPVTIAFAEHKSANNTGGGYVTVGTHKITKPIGATKCLWLEINAMALHGQDTRGHRGGRRYFSLGDIRFVKDGVTYGRDQGENKILRALTSRTLAYTNHGYRVDSSTNDYSFAGRFTLDLAGKEFPEGDTEVGEFDFQIENPHGRSFGINQEVSYVITAYWQ